MKDEASLTTGSTGINVFKLSSTYDVHMNVLEIYRETTTVKHNLQAR